MLFCVLLYEPGATSAWQRLGLPLLMAGAAALILQNLLGVLLGGIMLTGIHSDLVGDWVDRLAYPSILGLSSVIVVVILTQRFRQRIQATHSERWQARQDAQGSPPSNEQEP